MQFIEQQRPVIERSGLGLLPGIAIAFFLCMGMIAAIMTHSLWVLAAVMLGILAVTAIVLTIIGALLGDEDEIYSDSGKG